MSVAQQTAEKSKSPFAPDAAIVKKLLRLRKAELAQALASFPPSDVEAAVNEDLPASKAISLTEGRVKREERRRLFQTAKAVFNNRMSVVDCTIRNRSERGFLVDTKNSISIPEYFELHIPTTDRRIPVRAAWRNGAQLGLVIND